MDIFSLRKALIDDYRSFTGSFVQPRDSRIQEFLDRRLAVADQWPDPWLSLNPSFAPGGTPADLVREGLLEPACEAIFRVKKHPDDLGHDSIIFHRHQREAIEVARTGASYVLTTGTGSGKSLAYIVPIVDRILRERTTSSPGVKAIIVYPMNALANSQREELRKFLEYGFSVGERPVTFARYTGQENSEERRQILANPPDILLTNYVMLDLVLTRPEERQHLVSAARGLRFLVLDELHTYRGRQGADVAMLVRRVRDACESPDLQLVGTSATMVSEGTIEQRRRVVADVTSRLFGTAVEPRHVIGETLLRATTGDLPDVGTLARRVRELFEAGVLSTSYGELEADPLAAWVEDTFGLKIDEDSGELLRGAPQRVSDAAQKLAKETTSDPELCRDVLEQMLLAGSRVNHPSSQRPLFAFRLHQFVSKGHNVYASLEATDSRHLTGQYQLRVPDEPNKALLPLGFCRECGQEYYVVARVERDGHVLFVPREDRDASGGDGITGYIYVSEDHPWPLDPVTEGRFPDHWLITADDGSMSLAPNRSKYKPLSVWFQPDGTLSDDGDGLHAWFTPTPFAFCLRCRISYEQVRGSDFSKLATLDQEGRSSAVTVLSASVMRSLRAFEPTELPKNARKLLTFVDNRQDASLQAGHFNDFAQVAQLRSALCKALAANPAGLLHEVVAQEVTTALGMSIEDFAQNPTVKFSQKDMAERALRSVVEYRLYADLKRGWRVTMPNMEQVGLLEVRYVDLAEIAADVDTWTGAHGALVATSPETREELARIVLDEFRRVLAIDVDCLTERGFESIQKESRQHLRDPWLISDRERPDSVGTAFPRASTRGALRTDLNISGRSAFGRYLRRQQVFGQELKPDDAQDVIASLLATLAEVGTLTKIIDDDKGIPGYRLKASSICWMLGDGEHGSDDPLRREYDSETRPRANPFFRDLYRGAGLGLAGLYAREHTAQVPAELREEREAAFRDASLPLLYCSPTMELGVDIASLSAVTMRNVPPTPANYAQRSGRAGRQGQPAIVTTYCSSGNAHDNYWFRRSRDMVSGSVVPPRLDLGNEELVRSHVHAIWLAETGQSMQSSLTKVLDMTGDRPSLALLPDVWRALTDVEAAQRATKRAMYVLDELRKTWSSADDPVGWWHDAWVADTISHAPDNLDKALARWRDLYRTTKAEYLEQMKLSIVPGTSSREQDQAVRLVNEARGRLTLLANENSEVIQTDFYSYRYLASEGFLPGYSFPRLPLAAYIPGARGSLRDHDGGYLQRPRFVAIREFGPGALIYHEGSRYEVVRVQIPRSADAAGGINIEDARRCEECGYHHPISVGVDLCENCQARLGDKTYGLLRLQTVHTRRRERISSDEEERRRSGFEIETSFRFATHGERAGRIDAVAVNDGAPIAELVYGDAATLRLANVGRRRRKNPADRGYWLDPVTGKWLSDKKAADATVDSDGLDALDDAKTKQLVIPYVEDTRNIVLLRATGPVGQVAETSLRYALERGIEACYQLEDSELDSTALPDAQEYGRMLFTESAEGGAGVLRRLVNDPKALANVATTALELLHFDPITGDDLGHALGATERCEFGCYDCLLSFANQSEHALINRHEAKDLLLQLRNAVVQSGGGESLSRSDLLTTLRKACDSGLEGKFLDWIEEQGLRLPDRAQVSVESAAARPDFVYDLRSGPVAIFVDGPVQDSPVAATRDASATERLFDVGWDVLRFDHDADWAKIAAGRPNVFGPIIGARP